MKRVLFDTDVIVDAPMDRQPFGPLSIAALDTCKQGLAEGYVAGHAITTIYYLIRRQIGSERSLAAIAQLLATPKVAPVDDTGIRAALASDFGDFEDGVASKAAQGVHADLIVTRNVSDFKASTIPAVTPTVYLAGSRSETPSPEDA